ncbi:class I SAM-dependent methyltransferase [Streptomyces albulus]|nr:class I SAM-dependent methyltransferase [Streptomyces noursei]
MGTPAPHGTDGFWETTGAAKTFTHPIDPALLAEFVPRTARVLDYGCGYGRLTAELVGLGYGAVRGVDRSAALIARGRQAHPGLALLRWSGSRCPSRPAASTRRCCSRCSPASRRRRSAGDRRGAGAAGAAGRGAVRE